MCHSKAAIDYFISRLVFAREMKEFTSKLSASGWDLGATKVHPTTGFSGTNDTRHVLPLSVKHLDVPSQSHTNALVLGFLLQDETAVQRLIPQLESVESAAENLLNAIQTLHGVPVRVIIDVGAQILDRTNEEVARMWLRMSGVEIQAIVFFSDDDLCLIDRLGRIRSFQTSQFSKQLDVCLVYLDQNHARGTDLKLPRNYKAALTLGPGLTKDSLVQGAMRVRQLGKGQSIVFVVLSEIANKINERTYKSTSREITIEDVLCWSIGETRSDLRRSIPLWALQGQRYEDHNYLIDGADTTLQGAEDFLEDEAQSLDARYRPQARTSNGAPQFEGWDVNEPAIAEIISRCQAFEATDFYSTTLHEEQEREVAPEIEEERQIERPSIMAPERHQIHLGLQLLTRTGHLMSGSEAFQPAFQALHTTSAAHLADLAGFPTSLRLTADFVRTVKGGSLKSSFVSDSYQRPVQWILSVGTYDQIAQSYTIDKLIILSPFEANQLLVHVEKHAKVTLHLYAPQSNTTFTSLDSLELYNVGRSFIPGSISRSLTMLLNLFAGSHYLRSFDEYIELCDLLGLMTTTLKDGQKVLPDGFLDPPAGRWGLKKSPVPFLRALLLKVRREGEGVEKTHMGKILNGVRLEASDFRTDVQKIS